MTRRFLIAAVCIAFLLAWNAQSSSQPARMQQAQRRFARNRAEMTAIAQRFESGERTTLDTQSLRGVQRIAVHANPAWLEFQTGALGIVPSSVYYGVYYSPVDEPVEMDMGGGDNRWYTQRICENWYYFEASF